jgi:hypothetical protein
MSTVEAGQWPLLSRQALLTGGLTDAEIRRLTRAGDIARIRWGDYRSGSEPEFPEDRHRQLVYATAARFRVGSDAAVSHVSAAVAYGAPAYGVDLSRVHVTRPGRRGAAASAAIHPHRGVLSPDEITLLDGIPVTTPARTALDVARSLPFTPAVAILDALLHRKLVTPEEIAEQVERARRRGAARGAARVAAFADGLAESPAESHSRVVIARLGLPRPVLQSEIRTERGVFIGRVDFDMGELRTVGECDGESKYVRYLRPGETPAAAVLREKRREDEIRATGREMVRWVPSELWQPGVIWDRFVRAFARAGYPDWRPGPSRVPLGALKLPAPRTRPR